MIKVDSRKVELGDTFLALRGVDSDGHSFIEKAINNGAKEVICEEGSYSVETTIVPDTREYLADYLKDYYKDTMDNLKIIGITGTNGKTTTAFLIHKALFALGIRAAYIGTVGFYMNDKIRSLVNTTPDLYDLYGMFNEAYNMGAKVIVLEISSQGLAYGRLRGIEFDQGIFTNLTQDHLDYHKTMGNYALAKQELFKNIKTDGVAIINNDDSYKDYYLLKENNNITYGFDGGDYHITKYKMTGRGSSFTFTYKEEEYSIKTPLIGKYNLYNTISTIVSLKEYGIALDKIKKVIKDLNAPVGRMETIHYKDNSIIIDYAHTPDALEKIINTMREVTKGKVYVAFGCTGSRDRLKRPIMMNLVTNMADYTIVTSDDLHDEDFNQIVSDMTEGITNTNYEVIMDRAKAIKKGISYLDKNDSLLILGKGHEEFMIVGDKKIPFNDRKIVLDFLEKNNIIA